MTTASLEPLPWRPRRWAAAIGVVLLLQISALLFFSDSEPAPARIRSTPRTEWLAGTIRDEELKENWAVTDPTLFALASPHGFSARVWMARRMIDYPLTNWTEPYRWLDANPQRFGGEIANYLADDPPSKPRLIEKPLFPVAPALPAEQEARAASLWRLDGPLAGRLEPTPFELPSVPNNEILRASAVRLLVNPAGEVLSAVLLSGSGSTMADQRALDLAGRLKFRPLATPDRPLEIQFGDVIFSWRTIAPNLTNAPPNLPK